MIRSLHTLWWPLDAPGGISTGLKHLLRFRTQTLGLDVNLIHGNDFPKPGRLIPLVHSLGVPDRFKAEITKRAIQLARPVIEQRIDQIKPDILHPRDIYSLCATPKNGIPVVLHVHGPALEEALSSRACKNGDALAKLLSRMEQEAFERADLIIAVSDHEKQTLINKGVEPSKVRVLLNATDPDWLEQRAWAEPSPFDFPYIFAGRRLVPKNGIEILIRAFSLMQDATVKLVVAGGGPLMSHLRNLVGELGLEDRVLLMGSVAQERMPGLVKSALAAVVPSVPHAGVREASSHSALEAMALGVPVVASDIAGLSQLITHGETGLLVKPGDPEALALHLEKLLGDLDLRRGIGQNAAAFIRQTRSIRVWVQQLVGFYQEVLS